jgi:UDP-galactose transporter B1
MSIQLFPTIKVYVSVIYFCSAMALFSKDKDTTPMKMFAACSLTYLGAMLASNQSLQYISYPTQVSTVQSWHSNPL